MKDDIEKFITSNREAFDDQEPKPTAWNKISRSLPQMSERSLWNNVAMWRVAAALFFGLSAHLFISSSVVKPVDKGTEVAQYDFSDMESYYRSQIAEKITIINDYDTVGENLQFTQDFKKLDAMYQVLAEEMKNRPSKKVKDALILNLLVRIDLLNQQLKNLEDVRRKKNLRSET